MRRLTERLAGKGIYPWGGEKNIGAMIDRLKALWDRTHKQDLASRAGRGAEPEGAEVLAQARAVVKAIEERYNPF